MGRSAATSRTIAATSARPIPSVARRRASIFPRWRGAVRLGAIALAAGAATAAGWAHTARAGTLLISRDTVIHAAGGPGPNGFDLTNGTTDFGRFANDVNNDGTAAPAPASSEAHQYSVPGITGNSLQGAFAEGSVQTTITSPGGTAAAQSNFDLTFRVVGAPQAFTFGAAMGTSGGASAMAELVPVAEPSVAGALRVSPASTAGPITPIFSGHLQSGESKTMDQTGILGPGTYALHVHADASTPATDGSAYFNVSLTLASTAAAVPLPPAAWSGMGILLAVCTMTGLHQWSARRRTA